MTAGADIVNSSNSKLSGTVSPRQKFELLYVFRYLARLFHIFCTIRPTILTCQ